MALTVVTAAVVVEVLVVCGVVVEVYGFKQNRSAHVSNVDSYKCNSQLYLNTIYSR